MEDIVRQAEDFISSFTKSDLLYSDAVVVGRSLDWGEWVAVATSGAADEMSANDEPEPWPVRVRVRDADGAEAEAYLSIAEATKLATALRKAVARARTFPQWDINPDTGAG